MLQQEAVSSEMINLIRELQSNSLFKDHFLAGGAALALQLGHRTSADIDFFTSKKQNVELLTEHFKNNYGNTIVNITDKEFIRIYVNNIKVEMFYYEEKLLKKPKNEKKIRLFSLNDIAVMKLKAITGRTDARDFIDIAYLLKEIPIVKMFKQYKKKYGTIDQLNMKETLLIKSKTIKDNEWLVGIKMLRNDIIPQDIPKFIEKKLGDYKI